MARFDRSRTNHPKLITLLSLFAMFFVLATAAANPGKSDKTEKGPHPKTALVFVAEPATVTQSGFTNLVWDATNAANCSASGGWSGDKPLSGSEMVGPLIDTTTFTLQCGGSGKPAKENVTVTVAASAPSPTVTLSADPSVVNPNGNSTLAWLSTDAETCVAGNAWSGAKPTTGSELVGPINQDSTFTLTCTGPGGSASRPVTVTVQNVTGSADLSWIPPTTNEDGSPVILSGFKVYRGSSSSNLQQIASLGASVTVYTANNLSASTHYFAVTAVNNTGAESSFSNVESKITP